jgi:hypothetical protein
MENENTEGNERTSRPGYAGFVPSQGDVRRLRLLRVTAAE